MDEIRAWCNRFFYYFIHTHAPESHARDKKTLKKSHFEPASFNHKNCNKLDMQRIIQCFKRYCIDAPFGTENSIYLSLWKFLILSNIAILSKNWGVLTWRLDKTTNALDFEDLSLSAGAFMEDVAIKMWGFQLQMGRRVGHKTIITALFRFK